MTIIETISRQVPNNKEGKEYFKCWLQSHEGDENATVEWYEDVHGITMITKCWLEGYGKEMNT